MREYEISDRLKKKMLKLDRQRYIMLLKKMHEIISGLDHYKNLKSPLNEYKRVHIDKSFVLIFKYLVIL